MQRIAITVIITFLFLHIVLLCEGQAYHFSQFYSTPLLNNPAFTGYTDGQFRLATNFRSQWAQGSTPYVTTAVSFDTRGFKNYIDENNRAGAGIYFMNDQSSGGALQTNSVGLSAAYNLSLDEFKEHTIGIGLQGVFTQRKLDYSRLSFESQYGSNGFDPSLPVGEALNFSPKAILNANAGISYHYNRDYNAMFGSASVYNAFSPDESMLPYEFKTLRRYSLMAGGHLAIGYDQTIYGSINYMNQARANEITIGGAYGIQIGDDKKQEIDIGIWHRVKDAIIPYVGYQLKGFQFGFSYDYTISKLKAGGEVRNGFEITLSFTAEDKSGQSRFMPWY